MKNRLIATASAAALAVALAGCATTSQSEADVATPTHSVTTPSPSATPSTTPDGSGAAGVPADIASALTGAGFTPRAFSSTEDLLTSTFPGLAAEDPICLLPFGSDWAADPSLAGSEMGWGPTADHGMAAAVTSATSADAADALLTSLQSAVATCAEGGGAFSVHNVSVDMDVTPIETGLDGVDASAGWAATTTFRDTEYALVGMTARVGDTVTIVLSTSPSTTQVDVAAKLEQLTDQF